MALVEFLISSLIFNCVLQVKTCGFPPLEDREKSFSYFSGVDFFGGGILTKEETVSFRCDNT